MPLFICTTIGGRRHHHNDGDSTHDDDDDSESDHRKSRLGKRVTLDQNRWQELKLSHESLEQKWVEFQKKMDGPPFVLSVLVNQIKFTNALCDTGCLFYGIVDSKFVTKCELKRMKITLRDMQGYDGLTNGVCNEVVSIRFDINGHVENSFCYVTPKLGYNLILRKPWMEKNGVQYHPKPERLWIRSFKIKVENVFGKNPMKLDCMQISSSGFYMQSKRARRESNLEMFSASIADIDKALNVKPRIKPKTIVPEQYWDYLNVFDEDEINQLPPIRGKGINHGIELLEEKRSKKSTIIQ